MEINSGIQHTKCCSHLKDWETGNMSQTCCMNWKNIKMRVNKTSCIFFGPDTDLTLPDPVYFADIYCCLNCPRNVLDITSLHLKTDPAPAGCRFPAAWQTDLLNSA